MQPDPNRYDDDPEEQADELADGESFELSAAEEAELSQINDPHIKKHLMGIREGIERRKKERAAAERRAREEAEKPRQEEKKPNEAAEKTDKLPLRDEEELAEIEDPYERARIRQSKIQLYKKRPDIREYVEEKSRALEAERNKPILLEPWANDRRAAPNAVFRSALFPALNTRQGRRFVQKQKVYSVGGLDIVFTGHQFDQTDLDVYLELLNFAKAVPLGQPIKFSAYSLLKALGRCTGKTDHEWLHSVLVRLRGGTVEMVTEKARYFGGLIEGGIRDEITKHYDVVINPSYAKFFGFGLWSSLDLDQRRQLAQKSTAKALHAYYSTHTDPAPHRYDTLAGVVGLENKNRREMKASLIRAHEELKRVGFLLDYEAGPDKIAIKATMTPGQQQHLVRKAAKPRKAP